VAPADVPSLNELLSLPYGPAWLRGSQGSFLLQSRAGGAMGQSPGRDDAAAVFLCVLFVGLFFNACSELVNHCCCGDCDFLSVEQKKNALCMLFVLR